MESNVQDSSPNVLIKKLGLILSVFVFLLPVFFVPVSGVSLYVAKIVLLATGLVAIFAIFLSSVLSTGIVEIPKARYLLPLIIFAAVAVISSIFSGAIGLSIVGSVFESGTSGFFLMITFLMILTLVSARSSGVVNKVITAFVYAALVLVVYTILNAFVFPASLASKLPAFISGGIIDTAIIFGAAIIFSLCALNMTEVSRRIKYILYVLIAFSLIFIGATNFTPVVVILGIISLVFFVYILSWSFGRSKSGGEEGIQEKSGKKISLSSLIILVASIVLFLGGSGIGGFLSNSLRVQSVEVRPNFQTSMNLTMKSWQKNFAFGIGPNLFGNFWDANKPVQTNQTQFWNSTFRSGSGFVPTIAITTGLLGLLSILAFVVMYLLSGVKAIFAQANSLRSRYLSTSSFLVSLYLWIMFFVHTPGLTVLALAFIFTGIFTATLVPQGTISLKRINIFSNPKTNFLSVLSIVVLLIASVAGGYFVWEKAIAATTFDRGVIRYQMTGDIQSAKESIARSINLTESDVYWRGLTEISLVDLGRVLGGISNPNQIAEATRAEIQNLIANSVEAAKKAVEADRNNFQNWFTLARVYEVLTLNGVADSLADARSTYNEAALRSPNNPSVPLALARLDAFVGDAASARENIIKAIELKNNYTDAYFTLAQLEVAANNIPGAINSVQAATLTDPNNAGLYFQLGLLYYNQRNWAGSAAAFERATVLIPDYANARYFLGLSYYELDQTEKAIEQFQAIRATNPDNAEIDLILSNLEAGNAPFANTAAAASPGVGSELPLEED